ncbi:MAG: tRNA preQ1(34) S-adenosylmethionine ribosyltransferase-isomerase QueA [Deltaproteobacteria bacterium]|nr:tRNA preQ1(34) S-adenosylmethionine ribosyltransferase-isomerase QueA [Deltaproteobacteria bacterium]
MDTNLFSYSYPHELIAHHPLKERDAARMLVLDRSTGTITHTGVRALPERLRTGDVLVINTSRVIPARLIGQRESGGQIEILLVAPCTEPSRWWCLATRTNRLKSGDRITFAEGLEGRIEKREGDRIAIAFNANGDLLQQLDRIGLTPLPPYIDRSDDLDSIDRERYQTVYADLPGSAAAPTAGLHFTERLLDAVRARGAIIAPLTLYVSSDTFAPVHTDRIEDHTMHGERYEIPAETIAAVTAAKCDGRRVIAVGTTTVRALESAYNRAGSPQRGPDLTGISGTTRLFIMPGYEFRIVDAILTNFHQPCSTLLMLVSAFAGLDRIKHAYAEAVAERYRLFSYGDCMLMT